MTASGRASANGGADGVGVGDVEVGARERDDVVAGARGGGDDVAAQHARGPRDEKAHGATSIAHAVGGAQGRGASSKRASGSSSAVAEQLAQLLER